MPGKVGIHLWRHFGLPVILVCAAHSVETGILWKSAKALPPYFTFYPAVMFAALEGGLPSGLMATGLASLVTLFFSASPAGRLGHVSGRDVLELGIFIGVNSFLSFICDRRRSMQQRMEELVERRTAELGESRLAALASLEERKFAEEALHRSEQNYREIFNATGDAISVHDARTGRVLDVNDAMVRLHGYDSREEYLQAEGEQTETEDCRDASNEAKRRLLFALEQGAQVFASLNRRKNGESYWSETSWRKSQIGGEGRVLAVVRDITGRKRAEEELEWTRTTLMEAQKIAHLGSFEYVAATQATVWSEEEYRIYGLDPAGPSPAYEEMLSKCLPPEDAVLLHACFTKATQGRSVYTLEHRILRPDSSVRWVHDIAHPYFDEKGELVRYIGTTLDITERKQAEETMRQWADAFENCAHGIALGRPGKNEIMACNPAFARMIGRPVAEIIGRPIASVYDPADRERVKAHIEEADRTGQVRYVSRMVRADGLLFPVQMDVVSVRDAQGRPVYRVATAQDITERKAHEAEIGRLTRLYAALGQINQTIVRVKSREELFQQLCEITAKEGGFKVSWVGWHDPQTQQVMPIARAGDDSGYLDEIKVYADGRPEGSGPIGTCIRTGRPCVHNDFLNAPGSRPWREAAAAHGLRSAAAFPIRLRGDIVGAFTVYDHQVYAFQDREIALLEEAASDIDYAIEHIENERLRTRAEEALRASEERYRSLVEDQVDLVNRFKRDGTFVFANRGYRQFFGIPEGSAIAGKWQPVVCPEDLPMVHERLSSLRPDNPVVVVENRVFDAQGKIRWVQFSNLGFFDESGTLLEIQSVGRDITERKRAEAALRESEARRIEAQRIARIGNWEWNLRTGEVRWSAEIYAMNGMSQSSPALTSDTLLRLVHSDDAEKVKVAIAQAVSEGQPTNLDYRIVRADGSIRVIRAVGAVVEFDADGRPSVMVGTNQDITEHKQAEAALQRSEAHLRTLLNTLPDLVWLKDPQGVYLSCNARCESMFGVPEGEIVGKTDFDFLDRDRAEFFRAHDAAAVAAKGPRVNEEEVTFARDGHREFLETIKTPMFDANGSLIGVLGISHDITARKRTEERLRASEEQVRLKLDSILSPEVEVRDEELVNLLDIPTLQSLMDSFSRFSHAVVAILDTKGKILLSSGWQDICTQFHRIHPQTARNCTESDLALSQSLREGDHVAYHCRNGLWDMVTPLMVGGKHVGNIFTGQFFYEDDTVDEESFAAQAACCGFDREAYLAALRRVPRVSREWVANLMDFLTKISELISKSSFSNLRLAKALVQQKRIENDLRGSEEQFRAMFELASIGMAQADPRTGQWVRVNQKMCKITGYSTEELLRLSIGEVTHPEDRQHDRNLFWSVVRGETPDYHLEKRYVRKDGRIVWVNVNMTVIHDAAGQPWRTLAAIEDISERKRLEEERIAMEAQMRQQQKLESIGTLASGVAHEINNPINGIMNYAQLIQDRLPSDSPLAEFTREIVHETQRVASIVRNLLTFARNEKQSHSPARFADIMEAVLSLVRTVIRRDQILLSVNVPTDLPTLKCRSQQIQQVVMNLMTNARDALNERFAGHDPDKRLNVEARLLEKAGRRWIRLTVEDHGVGISPAVRERMFDPFFSTKGRDRGTGLGLSISHGIVKEHHGEWTVESEPGRFTRMHVDLPVDNGWRI